MNSTIKYLAIASAIMLGLAACEKTEAPAYEAAPVETGAQVFFPSAPAATVKLTKGEPSLTVMVARGDTTTVLDVPITASGDATTWFDVPAKVSFAAGEKSAKLVIAAKDVLTMAMNEFYPLTLSIDEELASEYGANSLSFNIGIELPWIVFDEAGTMVEGWWGEEEPGMPMKYQQISDNVRYCVVEGCWGHETGPTYPVQPYIWYWNTETNNCYIPPQFMGYSPSSGDVYIGDEPSFYNFYYYGAKGDGYVMNNFTLPVVAPSAVGTDAWFAFCDEMRSIYPEDAYPYYDGAGNFYLADYFYLVSRDTGYPTGSGYQFGGTQDMFVCSFAADYTVTVSYEGLFNSKEGTIYVMGDLHYGEYDDESEEYEGGGDADDVAIVLVAGKDPAAAVTVLAADEPENTIVVKEGDFRIALPENAADGFYTLVAVPIDDEGEYAWDFAAFETFVYGELDPLYLEYTSDDIVAGVAKDKLLGTTWVAFAAPAGGSASDRAAVANVTFTDAEDNEAGDDLITCAGILPASFPFTMEYYGGAIYTLASQNLGTASGYDVVYSTYSDENLGGNYTMFGAYVADGIIAFVNNSSSDNYYGMALWAVSEGSIAGSFARREYVLLVDPALLADPSSAPKNVAPAFSPVRTPFAYSTDSFRHELPAYDWHRDVVASGKVLSGDRNAVISLDELR